MVVGVIKEVIIIDPVRKEQWNYNNLLNYELVWKYCKMNFNKCVIVPGEISSLEKATKRIDLWTNKIGTDCLVELFYKRCLQKTSRISNSNSRVKYNSGSNWASNFKSDLKLRAQLFPELYDTKSNY